MMKTLKGKMMGLDQYVFAVKTMEVQEQIVYWRKHNAMHNWFTQKAIEQGIVSKANDFNCKKLPITQELLDELRQAVLDKKLEPVEGFFFGSTDYDPAEEMEADLEDIKKMQDKLNDGYEIYYDSWW